MNPGPLRSVAFYLPQFHPIPENDRFWSPGYTEWSRVVRAEPLFRGHEQPVLPGELGFYDLRVPETRAAQAELAALHAIDAFCYYHYWFGGRRLLARPLDDMLRSGEPDFPFCLCWANEDWRRHWDGRSGETLVSQCYSETDDVAHARWLAEVCSDHRYLKVDGRPLLLIYRASELPEPRRTTELWRTEFERLGVATPFLGRVESFGSERADPRELGFAAAVQFQPDWLHLRRQRRRRNYSSYAYASLMQQATTAPNPAWRRYPCVMPGWDNTPRNPTSATIFTGSTPSLYRQWVAASATRAMDDDTGNPLLFVNAWNEWGEGCHLEPDDRSGRAYLEAHALGIADARAAGSDLPTLR